MPCNHTERVKLACVMLLFEENDVTATRTNISQATVLHALRIRPDQTQAPKAAPVLWLRPISWGPGLGSSSSSHSDRPALRTGGHRGVIPALLSGLNLHCLSETDVLTSILAEVRLWRETRFINPERRRPARGLFPFISGSWTISGGSQVFNGHSARSDTPGEPLAGDNSSGSCRMPPLPVLKVHMVSRQGERKTRETLATDDF